MPPSRSQRPSTLTGLRMPGSAIDARTALRIEPVCSQISRPVARSLAMAVNGFGKVSMGASSRSVLRKLTMRLPSMRPPPARLTSSKPAILRQLRLRAHSSSASSLPAIYAAPTSAPMEQPATTSGSTFLSEPPQGPDVTPSARPRCRAQCRSWVSSYQLTPRLRRLRSAFIISAAPLHLSGDEPRKLRTRHDNYKEADGLKRDHERHVDRR